jgi:hypothetical protein
MNALSSILIPLTYYPCLGKSPTQNSESGPSKRNRQVSPCSSAQYRIVHQVTCSQRGNHVNHAKLANYLDNPKLFAGDSKAHALRGKEEIHIEEYMDDHPDITFIVYRSYDCNSYHDEVENDFDRLPIPRIDPSILSRIKAYFYSLRADGQDAVPASERIEIISQDLTLAISEAEEKIGGTLIGLDAETYLKTPYLSFYHSKDKLAKLLRDSNTTLTARSQVHLRELLNFLTISCGHEWSAANTLFKSAMVDETHFSKLFCIGDVVVQMIDAHPRAYLVEQCTNLGPLNQLELIVVSWTFDEVFRKQHLNLEVSWPSGADYVSIPSLNTYPLRHDNSGLAERLRKRGEQFWECRKRKYVGYESPNPGPEI